MFYLLQSVFFAMMLLQLSFAGFANTQKSNNLSKSCRCLPSQACWPTEKEWKQLERNLTGSLVKPKLGIADCFIHFNTQACALALKKIQNPFYLESIPGGLQSQGMLHAWNSKASAYAIEALNDKDIVEGVKFARKYNLRLVIKGTGHDYLGRSSAPDSLLIWTHKMRDIKVHDAFVPTGCKKKKGVAAVTVDAGARWIETYQKVTTKNHRYVQGGGCSSVGAAGGFIQGGGFGSFSKQFGTGAGGVLQVEIVTADGALLTANQCQNKDLFWAVRGGGGGTFGVVTKMTLQTHPLPSHLGLYTGTITASNDTAFKTLIKQMMLFFRDHLNNPNWGEQITFKPNNTLELALVFQGINKTEAQRVWAPFMAWLSEHSQEFKKTIDVVEIPGDKLFDYQYWKKHYPDFIKLDKRKNAPSGQFWWASNSKEIFQYWYTYRSWWLDRSVFANDRINTLAATLFQASRASQVGLHINKGLDGAARDAIKRSAKTPTNPSVYHSPTLVIMGSGTNQKFNGIKQHGIDKTEAEISKKNIDKAMNQIISLSPQSGAYVNEADYFQTNWQQAFWGDNYKRLWLIKQRYDPTGLFYCHHCVGSELWSSDGMCPVPNA